MRQKLSKLPEYFYSLSGLPVVTPENTRSWNDEVLREGRLRFQEHMSGSGAISLAALASGLAVGFPVDFRYGWNLRTLPHQNLLANFSATADYYAPTSGPWHSTSGNKSSSSGLAGKQRERVVLEWVAERLEQKQSRHHTTGIVEVPRGTTLLQESALNRIASDPLSTFVSVDQCAH